MASNSSDIWSPQYGAATFTSYTQSETPMSPSRNSYSSRSDSQRHSSDGDDHGRRRIVVSPSPSASDSYEDDDSLDEVEATLSNLDQDIDDTEQALTEWSRGSSTGYTQSTSGGYTGSTSYLALPTLGPRTGTAQVADPRMRLSKISERTEESRPNSQAISSTASLSRPANPTPDALRRSALFSGSHSPSHSRSSTDPGSDRGLPPPGRAAGLIAVFETNHPATQARSTSAAGHRPTSPFTATTSGQPAASSTGYGYGSSGYGYSSTYGYGSRPSSPSKSGRTGGQSTSAFSGGTESRPTLSSLFSPPLRPITADGRFRSLSPATGSYLTPTTISRGPTAFTTTNTRTDSRTDFTPTAGLSGRTETHTGSYTISREASDYTAGSFTAGARTPETRGPTNTVTQTAGTYITGSYTGGVTGDTYSTFTGTSVTPTSSLRRPQTSPRSPLSSVRNIVAQWKERTPLSKSGREGGSVSSASPPPDAGLFGIRRQASNRMRSTSQVGLGLGGLGSRPRDADDNTSIRSGRSGVFPPGFDLEEFAPTTQGAAPLHLGLLWYLNVHATPPYRWQRCQALLFPHQLVLSWLAPGGGRGVVSIDLLNCTNVQSAPSPTHPSARDDVGTVAAIRQSNEPNAQPLRDMLVPFHLHYADGVERLAAESLGERQKWVHRLWEVVNRPTSMPESSSVTRSPTGSIRTIMSIDSQSTTTSNGSRSTVFIPPLASLPSISDFQSNVSSSSKSSRRTSLGTSHITHTVDDTAISADGYIYRGDRRVITPSRGNSLRRSSMTDLDEEFADALRRARGARPGLGFRSVVLGGSPVTLSSGTTMGGDVYVTPPPSTGRGSDRARSEVSDEAFFSAGNGRGSGSSDPTTSFYSRDSFASTSGFGTLARSGGGGFGTTDESTYLGMSGVSGSDTRTGASTSYLGESGSGTYSSTATPTRTPLSRAKEVRRRQTRATSRSYTASSGSASSGYPTDMSLSDKENSEEGRGFGDSETYTPGSGTRTLDSGAYTPASGARTLDSGAYTPASGARMLDSGTYTPGSGTRTLDSGSYTPGSGTRTIDSDAYTPASATRTLESGGYTPGSRARTLPSASYTPGSGTTRTLDSGTYTPRSATYSIGSSDTPDQRSYSTQSGSQSRSTESYTQESGSYTFDSGTFTSSGSYTLSTASRLPTSDSESPSDGETPPISTTETPIFSTTATPLYSSETGYDICQSSDLSELSPASPPLGISPPSSSGSDRVSKVASDKFDTASQGSEDYVSARSPSTASFKSLPSIPSESEFMTVEGSARSTKYFSGSERYSDYITADRGSTVPGTEYITAEICPSEVDIIPSEASTPRQSVSDLEPVQEYPRPQDDERSLVDVPSLVASIHSPSTISDMILPEEIPLPSSVPTLSSSPPPLSTTSEHTDVPTPSPLRTPILPSEGLSTSWPSTSPPPSVTSSSSSLSDITPSSPSVLTTAPQVEQPQPQQPRVIRPTLSISDSSVSSLEALTPTTPSMMSRRPIPPPSPQTWAQDTNFSYESSVLAPSPSLRSVAIAEEPDTSYETSFLRPSVSEMSSIDRLSTIPESPYRDSTAMPSPLPSLTRLASPLHLQAPSTVSFSSESSTSLVRTASVSSTSSFMSESSMSSSLLDSRSLLDEPLEPEDIPLPLSEISTEPSLLSTPRGTIVVARSPVPSSRSMSPLPPPFEPYQQSLRPSSTRPASRIMTPEASISVSVSTPRGSERSPLPTNIETEQSSRSSITQPDLARDLDRLVEDLRGYDSNRGLENQQLADGIQALRDQLRDLSDFVRRPRTPPPVVVPAQPQVVVVPGAPPPPVIIGGVPQPQQPQQQPQVHVMRYVNEGVGRSETSSPRLIPMGPRGLGPHDVAVHGSTSLSRATSSASSVGSYLSSHHSDDESLASEELVSSLPDSPAPWMRDLSVSDGESDSFVSTDVGSIPRESSSLPSSSPIPPPPPSSPVPSTISVGTVRQTPVVDLSGINARLTAILQGQQTLHTEFMDKLDEIANRIGETVPQVTFPDDQGHLRSITERLTGIEDTLRNLENATRGLQRPIAEPRPEVPITMQDERPAPGFPIPQIPLFGQQPLQQRPQQTQPQVIVQPQPRRHPSIPSDGSESMTGSESGSDVMDFLRNLGAGPDGGQGALGTPADGRGASLTQQLDELLSARPSLPRFPVQPPPPLVPFIYQPADISLRPRSISPTGSVELPHRPHTARPHAPAEFERPQHPARGTRRRRPRFPEAPTEASFSPIIPEQRPRHGEEQSQEQTLEDVPDQRPEHPRQQRRRVPPVGPVMPYQPRSETAPPDFGRPPRQPDQIPFVVPPPPIFGEAATTPTPTRTPRRQTPGPTYLPMPAGPTFVQLPPLFDSLMEILRENRLAQIATVDQQRELMRYMRGLNEWLERDVHDRQAELLGVVARVDSLREEMRNLRMQEGGDTETTTTESSEHVQMPTPHHFPNVQPGQTGPVIPPGTGYQFPPYGSHSPVVPGTPVPGFHPVIPTMPGRQSGGQTIPVVPPQGMFRPPGGTPFRPPQDVDIGFIPPPEDGETTPTLPRPPIISMNPSSPSSSSSGSSSSDHGTHRTSRHSGRSRHSRHSRRPSRDSGSEGSESRQGETHIHIHPSTAGSVPQVMQDTTQPQFGQQPGFVQPQVVQPQQHQPIIQVIPASSASDGPRVGSPLHPDLHPQQQQGGGPPIVIQVPGQQIPITGGQPIYGVPSVGQPIYTTPSVGEGVIRVDTGRTGSRRTGSRRTGSYHTSRRGSRSGSSSRSRSDSRDSRERDRRHRRRRHRDSRSRTPSDERDGGRRRRRRRDPDDRRSRDETPSDERDGGRRPHRRRYSGDTGSGPRSEAPIILQQPSLSPSRRHPSPPLTHVGTVGQVPGAGITILPPIAPTHQTQPFIPQTPVIIQQPSQYSSSHRRHSHSDHRRTPSPTHTTYVPIPQVPIQTTRPASPVIIRRDSERQAAVPIIIPGVTGTSQSHHRTPSTHHAGLPPILHTHSSGHSPTRVVEVVPSGGRGPRSPSRHDYGRDHHRSRHGSPSYDRDRDRDRHRRRHSYSRSSSPGGRRRHGRHTSGRSRSPSPEYEGPAESRHRPRRQRTRGSRSPEDDDGHRSRPHRSSRSPTERTRSSRSPERDGHGGSHPRRTSRSPTERSRSPERDDHGRSRPSRIRRSSRGSRSPERDDHDRPGPSRRRRSGTRDSELEHDGGEGVHAALPITGSSGRTRTPHDSSDGTRPRPTRIGRSQSPRDTTRHTSLSPSPRRIPPRGHHAPPSVSEEDLGTPPHHVITIPSSIRRPPTILPYDDQARVPSIRRAPHRTPSAHRYPSHIEEEDEDEHEREEAARREEEEAVHHHSPPPSVERVSRVPTTPRRQSSGVGRRPTERSSVEDVPRPALIHPTEDVEDDRRSPSIRHIPPRHSAAPSRQGAATPLQLDDGEALERLVEVEHRLLDTVEATQEAEIQRENEFRQHEEAREALFLDSQERRDREARERVDAILEDVDTRLGELDAHRPARAETPHVAADQASLASVRTATQQAASQHASDIMEIVAAEREEFAREREAATEAANQRAQEQAQEIASLKEQLTRALADLENEKQQRMTEEAENRDMERQALQERDEGLHTQLGEITNIVQAQQEACERKKELMENRWQEKEERRGVKDAKMLELKEMLSKIYNDLEDDRIKVEEARELAESKPGVEKIIEELTRQNAAQQALLNEFSASWRDECAQHHKETIDAVRQTAQEQVPFNVQGYLDEFSKALASEVRMLLTEVGKLREERRALLFEIGNLLCTKSKWGPGGMFEEGWRPPQSEFAGGGGGMGPPGGPPGDHPPMPEPMTELPQTARPPAWRTKPKRRTKGTAAAAAAAAHAQPPLPSQAQFLPPPGGLPTSSYGAIPRPQMMSPRRQVASWNTWMPDANTHPSPISGEAPPNVVHPPSLNPPSPIPMGLFGPRSPRNSQYGN